MGQYLDTPRDKYNIFRISIRKMLQVYGVLMQACTPFHVERATLAECLLLAGNLVFNTQNE